jgi:hypothetical protein
MASHSRGLFLHVRCTILQYLLKVELHRAIWIGILYSLKVLFIYIYIYIYKPVVIYPERIVISTKIHTS